MQTVYVPRDYLTLSEVVDNVTDDVLVLLDPGTYVGDVDFLGNNVTLAARYPGKDVIITGWVFFNGTNNTAKGITFQGATAYSAQIIAENGILNVEDCTFYVPQSGYGVFNANSDTNVRRCKFFHDTGVTSVVNPVYVNYVPGNIDSCLFVDIFTNEDFVVGSSYGCLTNNTFVGCESHDSIIWCDKAYGNIIVDCAATYRGILTITENDYNTVYGLTGGASAYGTAGTHDLETDPELDAGYAATASACLNVTGNYYSYRHARVSNNLVPYDYAAGSLGAFLTVDENSRPLLTLGTSQLYSDGIRVAGGGTGYMVEGLYPGPVERAWAFSLSATRDYESNVVIYDVVANKYKAFKYVTGDTAPSASSNSVAWYFLGAATPAHLHNDERVFQADPDSYLFQSLLNEESPKFLVNSDMELFDNGMVVGNQLPTLANDRLINFTLLSNKESMPATRLLKIVARVSSGAPARIYRDWPNNLSDWTVTNVLGFDDFVVYSTGGANAVWLGPVNTRYTVKLEGISYG